MFVYQDQFPDYIEACDYLMDFPISMQSILQGAWTFNASEPNGTDFQSTGSNVNIYEPGELVFVTSVDGCVYQEIIRIYESPYLLHRAGFDRVFTNNGSTVNLTLDAHIGIQTNPGYNWIIEEWNGTSWIPLSPAPPQQKTVTINSLNQLTDYKVTLQITGGSTNCASNFQSSTTFNTGGRVSSGTVFPNEPIKLF